MTRRADLPRSQADFHAAENVLLVKRKPALHIPPAAGNHPAYQPIHWSVPDQGATIASASLQIHAAPLRAAAAQARAWLVARAAAMNILPNACTELLANQHNELLVDLTTPLKPPAEHHIIGTSTPRIDFPVKVTGALTFVHDMRVPRMPHGRVVRPPCAGVDHGEFIGNTLQSVDESTDS